MAADYAIADVQGCYDALQRLLEQIDFDEKQDRLWFVGDLVNRGPQSLEVLRFVQALPLKPIVCLGNHDLHLLARLFNCSSYANKDDTLDKVLQAEDREVIAHWLRQQSIAYYDPQLEVLLCHAGIAPSWSLAKALCLAQELELALRSEQFSEFLQHMYGNQPNYWSDNLHGIERLRSICNYFTRMRFCNAEGHLDLSFKGQLQQAPPTLYPWFLCPKRQSIDADIIFGHWAALQGYSPVQRIHAIDTGCLWGGSLTAMRIQDKQRFTVPGLELR